MSEKIWIAVQPICRACRPALSKPPWTPRCIPTRGASGGQLSRRLGSRRTLVRARVRRVGEESGPEPSGSDLLTIALLVFFVSLILIVGALLLLPAIL